MLLLIAAGLLIFYFGVRYYFKLTTGWCKSYVCLVGKTAIVTGANTGIGYYTALDFAKRGARVILACRNRDKAHEAQQRIIEATDNENILVKSLDLSSLQSVRDFAQDINKNEERIDILVHNAGAAGLESTKTTDGIEIIMQTNYFSHFLLTHLLIGLLKKSKPSRIINVSSIAASYWGKINLDQISEPSNDLKQLYCDAKLCQIFFTQELAKKLKGSGVTVYSLHPGAVETDLYRQLKFPLTLIWGIFIKWFFKTSEEGAQTTIYTAVAKGIEDLSGEHFADCKKVKTYAAAMDEGLAKKLWEKSELLVKLKSDEAI